MKYRDVEVLDKNERISDTDKERVRCENAREFLGLAVH
jgi:hypothetical protein